METDCIHRLACCWALKLFASEGAAPTFHVEPHKNDRQNPLTMTRSEVPITCLREIEGLTSVDFRYRIMKTFVLNLEGGIQPRQTSTTKPRITNQQRDPYAVVAETPTELILAVSVIVVSVSVTNVVPFTSVVAVVTEYATSVAFPDPEGPKSTLACVGRITSTETASVLFCANTEPSSLSAVAESSRPARYMERREKWPPTTGRDLKRMELGTSG